MIAAKTTWDDQGLCKPLALCPIGGKKRVTDLGAAGYLGFDALEDIGDDEIEKRKHVIAAGTLAIACLR